MAENDDIPRYTQLREFINAEREHYPGDSNNTFMMALGQAERYELFLRIILARYSPYADAFRAFTARVEAMNRELLRDHMEHGARIDMSPEHLALIQEINGITPITELESETFYLFAKILLDRLAIFLEHYFRPEHRDPLTKGYSFRSHDTLCAKLETFCRARGLVLPLALLSLMKELKEQISDFRDYQISHLDNPRIGHTTVWTGSGAPRISKTPVFVRDWSAGKAPVESRDLHELMTLVEQYFAAIFELVTTNRNKSAFLRVYVSGEKTASGAT